MKGTSHLAEHAKMVHKLPLKAIGWAGKVGLKVVS